MRGAAPNLYKKTKKCRPYLRTARSDGMDAKGDALLFPGYNVDNKIHL